jgi:hypothetical protein
LNDQWECHSASDSGFESQNVWFKYYGKGSTRLLYRWKKMPTVEKMDKRTLTQNIEKKQIITYFDLLSEEFIMLSPVRDTYDNQERQQIPYSAGTQQENVHQSQNEVTPPSQFCEKMCWKYSCGCISLVIVGLLISFGLLLLFSPLGLLVAALVPGAIILYCTWLFYQDQVTKGQMIGNNIL